MKKVICAILLLALCFTAFCGCQKGEDNVVRLNEVTHSVFYAPLYIALNLGYFDEQGLKVDITNGGGADRSMTAVISGQADIGLMGPEAAIYIYNEGRTDYPVIFGQLTKKDGSFLVARTEMPNFKWSDLVGSEILGGRRGGVPAMALEYALEKNSLTDGSNVTINYDVQYDLMISAFDGGTADYCTMFEPAASNFVAAGKGHIVASVGAEAGDMPFTAFMATKSYISKNTEKVKKFMTAIKKGMDYVKNNSSSVIAEGVAKSFDGTGKDVLAAAIESYKKISAYMETPVMKSEDFDRLQDVIIAAGVMSKKAVFADVVDNTIAASVS